MKLVKVLFLLPFTLLSFPSFPFATCARAESPYPDTAIVVGQTKNGSPTLQNARSSVRDSRSFIYVTYADTDSILVKRSTNQGQTWSVMGALLYPSPFPNLACPAVAILPGDTLFVAWQEDYYDSNSVWSEGIFVSQYDGTSWSSPQNISHHDPMGDAAQNPCLASGLGGRIHCVWQEQNRGVYYAGYQAGSWTFPENVASGGLVTFPSLVVDKVGDLHLVCELNYATYKKRTSGVWGPAETVSPTFGGGPSIVVDSLTVPYVFYCTAWNDSILPPADIFYQFKVGSGWSKPVDISNNNGFSRRINASMDVKDNIYAAWEDKTNDTTVGHSEIFYSTYDTQWSLPIAISDSTYPPNYFPNIGLPVTSDGVDVVWMRMLSLYDFQILYRRLPPLPSGVEDQSKKAFNVESLKLNVQSPSRRELSVSYFLPSQSKVSLILYDLSGRKVMVLDEGEKPSGRYQVRRSLSLPAGVYFLRLESGTTAMTRKVVVLR